MSMVLAGVTLAVGVGTAAYSANQSKKASSAAAGQQKQNTKGLSAYMKQVEKQNRDSAKATRKVPVPMVDYLGTGREAITLARETTPAMLALEQQYGSDYARNEVAVAGARSQAEQDVIRRQGLGLRDAIRGASRR